MLSIFLLLVFHHCLQALVVFKKPEGYKNETCGISFGKIRIPNCALTSQHIWRGTKAGLRTWPWQLLLDTPSSYCGAVLIHPKFGLTVSHCTYNEIFSDENGVYGGFVDYKDVRRGLEPKTWWEGKIVRIIEHPRYNYNNNNNDITIIEFETEAPLSETLFPACLPEIGHTNKIGEACYVAGWGENERQGSPEKLQELCVPIVNRTICEDNYGTVNRKITKNMFCAGYLNGLKDACQGDSGGPLVCEKNGIWILNGIVSFGNGCGLPDFPTVYTDVARYIKWIKRYVPL